ncbi:isoaspartyl peptidase/L-asparaginase family protein [Longibacter salinarum]|nr:isoaspartyl peptidase/L-asparaginase [Longibacter salinarum]
MSPSDAPIAIVVHGGAGTILPENMTPEKEEDIRAALRSALESGYDVLENDGSSLDAVVETLVLLEDSPLFNAGRGAVFTHEGTVEHDASIMHGGTRAAGALTGVSTVRNPIRLARAILEHSEHVMMSGEGAEAFARQQGFDPVENEYFYTERRRQQLRNALSREETQLDEPENKDSDVDAGSEDGGPTGASDAPDVSKFGTVGAVALDRTGTISAGTSTGGMTNKRWGRVGDSPIIGAGTYAHNETCGVSATGHGEYFIRGVVTHDIAARMRYGGKSLQEAADEVVMEELPAIGEGGSGGVIALDAEGNIAMPFNTPGMYRGYVDADGNIVIKIYGEEHEETNGDE